MTGYHYLLIGGLIALAYAAGANKGARMGAQMAVDEAQRQFDELTWWQKVRIGLGLDDPMEVLDTSALNGPPVRS